MNITLGGQISDLPAELLEEPKRLDIIVTGESYGVSQKQNAKVWDKKKI
jgi:hypothetical protein